jgi:V8-like Glu-specific endopeptidase
MSRASLVAITTFLVGVSASATAQTAKFTVPREKVLAIGLEEKKIEPPFAARPPFTPPSGNVWTQRVTHPSAVKGIRVHVIVDAPGTHAWTLTVKNAGGVVVEKIESTSLLVANGSFWTTEVDGQAATLQISTAEAPAEVSLSVDRYAFRVSPSQKQGTVGPDQKQPIGEAPTNVRAWAPPVARLTIMTPLGGAYCTGFLLDDTLMITNEHCVHDKEEAVSTIAEFGYDTLSSNRDVVRVTELVAVDPGLDFAIVRLEKTPPSKYKPVTLETQSDVVDGAGLAVIQHPQGQPKMVSLKDCKVRGIDRVGVGNEKTDFGHLCDTLPGSSGSPVFALSSGHVVGLHHLGYPEGSPDPENQGVRFAEIVKQLKAQHPPVAQELHLQ